MCTRAGDYVKVLEMESCHCKIHSLVMYDTNPGTTAVEDEENVRVKEKELEAVDTTRPTQPPSGMDGIPYLYYD